MTGTRSRRPKPDRARRRAIRTLATRLGVPYSVAARLLTAAPPGSRPPRFPIGRDEHRAFMFAEREHRPYLARVTDTRLAAALPLGRAEHLTRRFPPLRPAGLYCAEGREIVLAMLYVVVAHESPELLPSTEELAWAADLGEESAVDLACAGLDRTARRLLDLDRWRLWPRIETALASPDLTRDTSVPLNRELRSRSLRDAFDGAAQILDALLVEAYDGLPPGVRVRAGTVIGAVWGEAGGPSAYLVRSGDEPPRVQCVATLSPEVTDELS